MKCPVCALNNECVYCLSQRRNSSPTRRKHFNGSFILFLCALIITYNSDVLTLSASIQMLLYFQEKEKKRERICFLQRYLSPFLVASYNGWVNWGGNKRKKDWMQVWSSSVCVCGQLHSRRPCCLTSKFFTVLWQLSNPHMRRIARLLLWSGGIRRDFRQENLKRPAVNRGAAKPEMNNSRVAGRR